MHSLSSPSALAPFFSNVRGTIRPGSHRLQQLLCEKLAAGVLNQTCILVTGSNGKGTTCAFLESALRYLGYRTGLYTSPHLVDPTERIRINGIPIAEEELAATLEEILQYRSKYLPDASFFEITTATAFVLFLKSNIDILICEIGLGGHYDSTNALSPVLSVLTNVCLEHTDILGEQIEKIAQDKAFIGRRNRPLILGDLQDKALAGVEKTAQITGCVLIKQEENISEKYKNIFHDVLTTQRIWIKSNQKNLLLALKCLQELEKEGKGNFNSSALTQGLAETFWPGRFDIRCIREQTVIIDASHNSHGFQYFLEQYALSPFAGQKFTLLFASLNDKDWQKTLLLFQDIVAKVYFTQITSYRALPIETLQKGAPLGLDCTTTADWQKTLDLLLDGKASQGPLVITGSIAFIGEVMQYLKIKPFI